MSGYLKNTQITKTLNSRSDEVDHHDDLVHHFYKTFFYILIFRVSEKSQDTLLF